MASNGTAVRSAQNQRTLAPIGLKKSNELDEILNDIFQDTEAESSLRERTLANTWGTREREFSSPQGCLSTQDDGGQTVLTWQTSQEGPRKCVTVSKETVKRPGTTGRQDAFPPVRFTDERSLLDVVDGRRFPGPPSYQESRTLQTHTETKTRERMLSPVFRRPVNGDRARVPPAPPNRRRVISPDEMVTTDGGGTVHLSHSDIPSQGFPSTSVAAPQKRSTGVSIHRNYASEGEEALTWLEEQRRKLELKRATGRIVNYHRQQQQQQQHDRSKSSTDFTRRGPGVPQSDTDDFVNPPKSGILHLKNSLSEDSLNRTQGKTRAGYSRTLEPPHFTKDYGNFSRFKPVESRRRWDDDNRGGRDERFYDVSSIQRPSSATPHTKYSFTMPGPSSSQYDEFGRWARPAGLSAPTSPVIPARGISSRDAVVRSKGKASEWFAVRENAMTYDRLDDADQTLRKGTGVHLTAPLKPVPTEAERISLLPIGRGVQDLEPGGTSVDGGTLDFRRSTPTLNRTNQGDYALRNQELRSKSSLGRSSAQMISPASQRRDLNYATMPISTTTGHASTLRDSSSVFAPIQRPLASLTPAPPSGDSTTYQAERRMYSETVRGSLPGSGQLGYDVQQHGHVLSNTGQQQQATNRQLVTQQWLQQQQQPLSQQQQQQQQFSQQEVQYRQQIQQQHQLQQQQEQQFLLQEQQRQLQEQQRQLELQQEQQRQFQLQEEQRLLQLQQEQQRQLQLQEQKRQLQLQEEQRLLQLKLEQQRQLQLQQEQQMQLQLQQEQQRQLQLQEQQRQLQLQEEQRQLQLQEQQRQLQLQEQQKQLQLQEQQRQLQLQQEQQRQLQLQEQQRQLQLQEQQRLLQLQEEQRQLQIQEQQRQLQEQQRQLELQQEQQRQLQLQEQQRQLQLQEQQKQLQLQEQQKLLQLQQEQQKQLQLQQEQQRQFQLKQDQQRQLQLQQEQQKQLQQQQQQFHSQTIQRMYVVEQKTESRHQPIASQTLDSRVGETSFSSSGQPLSQFAFRETSSFVEPHRSTISDAASVQVNSSTNQFTNEQRGAQLQAGSGDQTIEVSQAIAGHTTAAGQVGGNQVGGSQVGGIQVGGNQAGGNQVALNQVGGTQVGLNQTGGQVIEQRYVVERQVIGRGQTGSQASSINQTGVQGGVNQVGVQQPTGGQVIEQRYIVEREVIGRGQGGQQRSTNLSVGQADLHVNQTGGQITHAVGTGQGGYQAAYQGGTQTGTVQASQQQGNTYKTVEKNSWVQGTGTQEAGTGHREQQGVRFGGTDVESKVLSGPGGFSERVEVMSAERGGQQQHQQQQHQQQQQQHQQHQQHHQQQQQHQHQQSYGYEFQHTGEQGSDGSSVWTMQRGGTNDGRSISAAASHQGIGSINPGGSWTLRPDVARSGGHQRNASGSYVNAPRFSLSGTRTASDTCITDGAVWSHQPPRFVRDTSKYWHKPNISREDAIGLLLDKEPGSFVVRSSSTFPGSFGLALKVSQVPPNMQTKGGDPQIDLIRHFLIEPTPKGVRLKGCSNEPVFASLAALIYQHSVTPLSLPCKLKLPDEDIDALDAAASLSGPDSQLNGAACTVLYMGSVETENLTGPEALARSIKELFESGRPLPRSTIVQFKVTRDGITLTDNRRRIFFRRFYPIQTITFCGADPRDRRWTVKSEDITISGKAFGFVARKPGVARENACHVFLELDPTQPANVIVNFVTKVIIGQGQRLLQ